MTDRANTGFTPKPRAEGPKVGRRGFFGASLGLAAAGLAAGGALPSFAAETGDARTKARYQADSEHVKHFYHVNRFVWPEKK